MKKLLFGVIWIFITGTFYGHAATNAPMQQADYPFDDLYSPWVDSVFNSLTPEQRIGQLFFAAAYSNKDKKHVDLISEYIRKYHLGGLIFFQGGPKRQVMLTNQYQKMAQTPLMIAMDAEWGLGMRLDSAISFPRQMPLGAIQDVDIIYRMGLEIGMQCRRMGVHLNFAPVVDVNNNPDNPVIGIRSFGENSHDVTNKSLLYMNGLQRMNILTAAKHFPGHGNTSVDSHHSLPVINGSYASLDTLEWLPYKELIDHQLTGVLAAHVHVPGLDSTPNLAASLSRKVLTDILRDSLKFNGLVYTDALNMKGVTRFFKPGELEILAIEAGADVLLMPDNIPVAISAVKAAVDSGRISMERIDQSCRRILAAKQWVGLNNYQPVDTTRLLAQINHPNADLLNRKLVEATLTVVQNQHDILPLKELGQEKTAILITGVSLPNQFLETLRLYEENNYYYLDGKTSASDEKYLYEELKRNYTRVVVGIHNTRYRTDGKYGIAPNIFSFVDRLSEITNVVLCMFAPPYALSGFNNKDKLAAIVVAYQDAPLFQDYTAQLLYGSIAAKGKLPVTVDSVYRYHDGIETAGNLRLKYSIPEEAGIVAQKLSSIDTMIQAAIEDKALPGCQVLAARNGIVFLKKEYGSTRYDEKGEPIHPAHIYDLASITKIAAALPSIMLFYDRDEIKLRDHLGEHLPFLKESDKSRITFIDLLTHQARLQPYIPFYMSTMEASDTSRTLLSRFQSPLYCIRLSAKSYLNIQRKYKDGYYTTSKDNRHQLLVAENMYLMTSFRDTIFNGIRESKLLVKKQYRYSDLGFILLTPIIEHKSDLTLDEFVSRHFYRRLGASTLGYHPLERFPLGRIVPTAKDTIFRDQWLQGYVHDENAALLGGVSGHAGVFGNANDLAKLMQMYLNMGIYGDERYIEEKTMETFTSAPFRRQGNRRGIGFDKPETDSRKQNPAAGNASLESFGHSGFTGTYTWADPKTGLLLVFLSNRICPETTNTKLITSDLRTRVFELLTDAIEIKE